MNPPPLPQPSASTCPNCGAAIEGHPPFCPHCGASFQVAASKSGGCIMIGVQVCLGLLAVVLGLCGACFVLVGGNYGGDFSSGGFIFVGFGLGILALGGLCIWGIFKMNKR